MRTRVCLFCLLAVSVHANPERYLRVCTSQQKLNTNIPTPFQCIVVDPCNSVDEPVTPNTYHHVGIWENWTTPAQTEATVHQHIYEHSIERVRVPEGVVLSVAQADFTNSNEIDGTTEIITPGDCTDTIQPACDVDPTGGTTRIIPGGLQMMKWSLHHDYSCEAKTPQAGQRLQPQTPPYKIVHCTKPEVASWIPDTTCEYQCPPDHYQDFYGRPGCEFQCDVSNSQNEKDPWVPTPGYPSDPSDHTCGNRQHKTLACTTNQGKIYYVCHDCTYSRNRKSVDSINNECRDEDCGEHHTGLDGVCSPCPANMERLSTATESECTACASGKKSESGAPCGECFNPQHDLQGVTCSTGMQKVADGELIYAYFEDDPKVEQYFDLNLFCKQNYACLPCKPGSFLSDTTTCDECAPGTYQPNYAATSCFNCSPYSTSDAGSTELSDCVCTEGYQ